MPLAKNTQTLTPRRSSRMQTTTSLNSLRRGVGPRTHAEMIHMRNTELVKAGLLLSSHNRSLSGLQRSRGLADCDAGMTFSADDAKTYIDEAKTFSAAALAFLRKDGWI